MNSLFGGLGGRWVKIHHQPLNHLFGIEHLSWQHLQNGFRIVGLVLLQLFGHPQRLSCLTYIILQIVILTCWSTAKQFMMGWVLAIPWWGWKASVFLTTYRITWLIENFVSFGLFVPCSEFFLANDINLPCSGPDSSDTKLFIKFWSFWIWLTGEFPKLQKSKISGVIL